MTNNFKTIEYYGLTKREYFAAMAMQTMGKPDFYYGVQETKDSLEKWSSQCAQLADAIIKALNKNPQP